MRLACLVLLAGCSKKEEAKPRPAPPPPATPEPARPTPEPPHVPEAPALPIVDAASPSSMATGRYLAAYLDLLWVHQSLNEALLRYPGAPPTNRYSSYSYEWKLYANEQSAIETAVKLAYETARRYTDGGDADRAVLAYTTEVVAAMPRLGALFEYYRDKRFVDDEFAHGRREAKLVPEVLAKLAPLRTPMVDAIFAGWREAAGDKPESPRAIIGASFEKCMRVGKLIYDQDPKAQPEKKELEKIERAIDDALGACRQSVGAVSALPAPYSSFAVPLRAAAVAFGDTSLSAWKREYTTNDIENLVKAYVQQWPNLPSEPAERPADR